MLEFVINGTEGIYNYNGSNQLIFSYENEFSYRELSPHEHAIMQQIDWYLSNYDIKNIELGDMHITSRSFGVMDDEPKRVFDIHEEVFVRTRFRPYINDKRIDMSGHVVEAYVPAKIIGIKAIEDHSVMSNRGYKYKYSVKTEKEEWRDIEQDRIMSRNLKVIGV